MIDGERMTAGDSPAGKNQRPSVTVMGLGPMGRALAAALLAAGHPTTVWNRTPEKADQLVARGAAPSDSPAEAVEASQFVIVCVADYGVVQAILEPVGEAIAGKTLVNLTADSPQRARMMAEWASEHGVDYLDGAIMTPAATIGTDAASVLYSGPKDLFEAHHQTLAGLGGAATYLGCDYGRAAAFDVALLDIFWTAMSGYVHALALANAEGIPSGDLLPHAQGVVGLLPDIFAEFALHVADGRYPGEDSNIASAAAGIAHIIQSANEHGIDAGVLRAAHAVARRAIEAGHAEDGFSRLSETVRSATPMTVKL